MRMVAVQWIADVLRNPVTGLGALVGSVPALDGWPVTPAVEIFDEAQHAWVAGNALPQSVLTDSHAGVIIRRVQPSEGDVLPAGNGFDAVTTALHYVSRVAAGDLPRNQQALIAEQTLRCARRALSIALPEFVQMTYPMVNGCEIGMPDTNAFSYVPMQAPIEGGLLFDALLVRLVIHDPWALGVDLAPTP